MTNKVTHMPWWQMYNPVISENSCNGFASSTQNNQSKRACRKVIPMIMLMMRSALGYPELGLAFDYRDNLFCLKPP